jgi:hypothetical protein
VTNINIFINKMKITKVHKEKNLTPLKNSNLSQAQWLKPIILTTWEAVISRTADKCQPRQKVCVVCVTPISTNGWAWWHMLVIPAVWESIKYEGHNPAWPRHKARPFLKHF